MGGDDLGQLPLSMRKQNRVRLLGSCSDRLSVAPFEQGEIGPDMFRRVCEFGLEGLGVEACRAHYSAGRCNHWIR
jgi:bifunctional non-homologous end joining protein LigD